MAVMAWVVLGRLPVPPLEGVLPHPGLLVPVWLALPLQPWLSWPQ